MEFGEMKWELLAEFIRLSPEKRGDDLADEVHWLTPWPRRQSRPPVCKHKNIPTWYPLSCAPSTGPTHLEPEGALHTHPSVGSSPCSESYSASPPMGFCPKELKSESQRGLSTPVFITVSLTTVRVWNDLNVGNRWTDEEDATGTCKGTPLRLQREKFCKMGQHKWSLRTLCSVNKSIRKNLGSTYMRYVKWKSQIPMVSKSRTLVTETGNRGEREVTEGQAGSFSQVRWTNPRVCCTALKQQSTIMDYDHLMSLTGYVRYSDTNKLVYETQNHRCREQICGYQGSRGGTN